MKIKQNPEGVTYYSRIVTLLLVKIFSNKMSNELEIQPIFIGMLP